MSDKKVIEYEVISEVDSLRKQIIVLRTSSR